MLQFFDDLPDDRWAAFVHVERLVRENHRTERHRKYVQMVLVAAFELKLRILPEWQSEFGLLYRVAGLGLNQDDSFEQFDRDLAAVLSKIQWLADQRKAPKTRRAPPVSQPAFGGSRNSDALTHQTTGKADIAFCDADFCF